MSGTAANLQQYGFQQEKKSSYCTSSIKDLNSTGYGVGTLKELCINKCLQTFKN